MFATLQAIKIPKEERDAGYQAAMKYSCAMKAERGEVRLLVNAVLRAVRKLQAASNGREVN